jgi:hypothetical protein
VRIEARSLVGSGAAVAMAFLAGFAAPSASHALTPGCSPDRPTAARHVSGAAATAPALVPCRFDTGVRAMEPSFAFDRHGAILYQGWVLRDAVPGGAPPYPVVVRSTDGVVWDDVSPLGAVTSLDPVIYADPRTGRVFSLNYAGAGQPVGATLSYTDDSGAHWTTALIGGGVGFDGQSIGAGPPVTSHPIGYPDLVYYCTGTTPGSSPPLTTPICSKSLDGGLTFTPTGKLPWPLTGPDDVFGPWTGNPVVGPDGSLYLPKRFDGQPEIAISRNEGRTWTRRQIATNGSAGAANRVAVDVDGNLYYTWAGDDRRPYVAYSIDRGLTWSSPIQIAPPDVTEADLPRIAVDTPGRIAVVYLGSTNASGGPPYYAYCDVLLSSCADGNYAGVRWNGYMAQIDDLFDPDPIVRTATVNVPAQPLFIGGCSADGACMANLDFIDVHFAPDGVAWGAFVDDCALRRGFIPIFTRGTPVCGDNVGEGILGSLAPAP